MLHAATMMKSFNQDERFQHYSNSAKLQDFLSSSAVPAASGYMRRYQSATFSSAAHDRRLASAQLRAPSNAQPTVGIASNQHKGGVAPDISCHNCAIMLNSSSNQHNHPSSPNILVDPHICDSALDILSAQHKGSICSICKQDIFDHRFCHSAPNFSPNPDINDSITRNASCSSEISSISCNRCTSPDICMCKATSDALVSKDKSNMESLASFDKPQRRSFSASKCKATLLANSSNTDALMSPRIDALLARDRRRLPGRRASLDGGMWPASDIKLSAMARFGDGTQAVSAQGAKPITHKEEGSIDILANFINTKQHMKHRSSSFNQSDQIPHQEARSPNRKPLQSLEAVGSPIPHVCCGSPGHTKNGPTPSNKQLSGKQTKSSMTQLDKQLSGKQTKSSTTPLDTDDALPTNVNSPLRSERKEKMKTKGSHSQEGEIAKNSPLGKQLGEHFHNLGSTDVCQLIKSAYEDGTQPWKMKKKNEAVTSNTANPTTPHRSVRGENVKPPVEDMNHKLGYKLHSILESSPAPKQAMNVIAKKSPSSIRQAVASLLVPSRFKIHTSKKEDEIKGPLFSRSLSSSHSSTSSTFSTGPNAKVIRSFSLDEREVHTPSKIFKRGAPKNKNTPSNRVPERSCRSLEYGFDSIDSSGGLISDTESSSSGSSGARPQDLSGDGIATQTSTPGRFPRHHFRGPVPETNGVAKPISHSRLKSALSTFGQEATPRSRRLEGNPATIDLVLLLNRYTQWRFVNASAEAAAQSQNAVAESLLYNACISLFQLHTSVASQQTVLNKAMLDQKLYSIIQNLSESLEKWDVVRQDHLNDIDNLVKALEAAVVSIPMIGGAQVDTHSLKNALSSAITIMDRMIPSITRLLPQAEVGDSLLSELAEVAVLERRSMEELNDLIASISMSEMEERCLRASLMQMEAEKTSVKAY